jgi:hypothetical protein
MNQNADQVAFGSHIASKLESQVFLEIRFEFYRNSWALVVIHVANVFVIRFKVKVIVR